MLPTTSNVLTYEEDFSAQGAVIWVDYEGSDDADDTVPGPVAGSRKCNALCSNWELEDLADNNPGGGSPRRGEEEYIKADEHYHAVIRRGSLSVRRPDGGYDEFAHGHGNSTPYEQWAATVLLDGVEGQRCGPYVDNGGNHRD